MFQVLLFFMIFYKILCKNPFNLFSYFFYKITKIKIKSFECPKSIKSIKNSTWNIRLLVDDLFVPSSKQPSVIYCRLPDFRPWEKSPFVMYKNINTGKACLLTLYGVQGVHKTSHTLFLKLFQFDDIDCNLSSIFLPTKS